MKSSKILFLVFVIVMSLWVVNTQPVIPQSFETIIIKADGSVDPSTAPITRTGNVYTLTRNIIGSVTIAKNDIIFDGAGYTVQYGGEESLPQLEPDNLLTSDNHIGWGVITLDQINHVTIKNVNIVGTGKPPEANSGVGIWLFDSNSSTITNNTLSTIYYGITASDRCSGNLVAGNTVMEIYVGISFSSDYRISNNTITGNHVTGGYKGIEIQMNHDGDASGNAVVGNQIANNQIGMYFLWRGNYYSWKPDPFEMNTRIYYNNFINNSQNVVNGHIIYTPDCANIWDNGAVGNYWSDYNGTDANRDGIGDNPYIIDENNQDNYPLMNPVVDPEFPDEENPTPTTEPFPITWIVATTVIITIAAVGAALLVYFWKVKKTTGKAE